jgi:LysR family transcriptional regulator (chromosome initiation inhibitor)
MTTPHFDYRALGVLDAVASAGSFDQAALLLGSDPGEVAEQVKALEDTLGRLLVVRGLPCAPTGMGQRLIAHYRQVRLLEAALDIDLGRDASLPDIRLAIDPDSLSSWFAQVLAPLLTPARWQLELRAAEPAEALALVRDAMVLGCVTQGDPVGLADGGDGGPSSTALGSLRYLCVATPAFAARWFGDGWTVDAVQLATAAVRTRALLARFIAAQLQYTGAWPHHTVPQPAELVMAGGAYGLLPAPAVHGALAQGLLVDLAPGRWLDVPLTWHAWNLDTPATRALAEHVIATARRLLVPAAPAPADLAPGA